MLRISDLKIDPRSFGSKFWLTGVSPAYQYTNGQRTDTVTGYRYSICLPEMGLEKVNVRVDGPQLMEAPESGYIEVSLTGLEIFVFFQNGQPTVGARATNIGPVNNKG